MCINSSKVYCKLTCFSSILSSDSVLIVAKCIVNISNTLLSDENVNVLIVAKCIVNRGSWDYHIPRIQGINSSKVYCKSLKALK